MLIGISIVSAILAGMGVGGGTIFVLLTTTFLGFEQKYAQTLNLIMFIFVGLSATVSNFKNKKIDVSIIKRTVPMLLIGSFIGTYLFLKIEESILKKYFTYFLIILGIYEIITSLIKLKKGKNNSISK